MQYRSDIDGLRALAVLPVVLFHAGIPGFGGGFVGVDIFFVISGYLITGLIAGELRDGSFSLSRFYERRVRRLFPALFAVLAFCSVAGALILLPQDFQSLGASMAAATLFASNYYFALQSGYFAGPAETLPLLHTWSLAVEEQFYIAFPLILLATSRWLGRRWLTVILPLAVVSFAACVVLVEANRGAAFYSTTLRAWELMLGALLALGAVPQLKRQSHREAGSILGLLLIVWSVAVFSKDTVFPGFATLAPTLGAAVVIHAGVGGSAWVNDLLRHRLVVFLGLISYSLYLWHWPLLVFARYYAIHDLSLLQSLCVVALSLGVAAVSWRYIEMPFRRRIVFPQRGPLMTGAAAALAGVFVFGVWGHASKGWAERMQDKVVEIAAYAQSRNPERAHCLSRQNHYLTPAESCVYGAPGVPPHYALWGDSHADSLIPALGQRAAHHGEAVRFFGYAVCPPFLGVERVNVSGPVSCINHNDSVMALIEADPAIQTVLIAARYALYLHGTTADIGPAEKTSTVPRIGDSTGNDLTPQQTKRLLARQLRATVERLIEAGKQVILIDPVPEAGYDVPSTLARMAAYGRDYSSFTRPYELYRARNFLAVSLLDALSEDVPGIRRIRPQRRLCDGEVCLLSVAGRPLYYDDDHLSLAGGEYLAPLFDAVFEEQAAAR